MTKHVTGEDLFDIVEEYGEGGIKSFVVYFKAKEVNPEPIGSFVTRDGASWASDVWVRRNQDHPAVIDAQFEKEVLEAPTGLEPVLTD